LIVARSRFECAGALRLLLEDIEGVGDWYELFILVELFSQKEGRAARPFPDL
jgi:hypothetical protein